jgi:hypothetical protein
METRGEPPSLPAPVSKLQRIGVVVLNVRDLGKTRDGMTENVMAEAGRRGHVLP